MSNGIHQVLVKGSEQLFSCGAGEPLMRAAQRAGIGFPYECNVGACGNCKFELIEGEIDVAWPEAPGWSERDRQRRRFLGCQCTPHSNVEIKLRTDPRYEPRHRPRRQQAVLTARRDITHDIAEFSFRLEAPQTFEPGQYALLQLPGVQGVRAYSMSNAGDGSRWEFQVRRVAGGRGTAVLFDELQAGQGIGIDGPYGMAWLRRAAPRDIICLAGGAGLAPMISIARGAMSEPALDGRQLHFLYGARTPADVCGEDMLRALPGWGERLHYEAAISADTEGWTGPVGFLHERLQARFGASLPAHEVYFSGPPPMVTAVQKVLLEAGVPPAQMHFDQFY